MIKLITSTFYLMIVLGQTQAFAGWKITAANTIQGLPIAQTNLIAINIQSNNVRMDIGSMASVIVLPDQSVQIQLSHFSKQYQRQSMDGNVNTNEALSPFSPTGIQVAFNGYQAEMFCFTNGMDISRIWALPVPQFLKSITNKLERIPPSVDLFHLKTVGTSFHTNLIILGTEYTIASPVSVSPSFGVSNSPMQFVKVTVISKLISIIETNFPPSEFELPKDYTDAGTTLRQALQIDSIKYSGDPGRGVDPLAGLRAAAAQGKPPLVHQFNPH